MPQSPSPEFGLALGGGAARGLVHIHVLEVLDELGVRPKVIAGTSIGAIYGAAYASGMSGAEIRELSIEALGKRINILKNLFAHRPSALLQLWTVTDLSRSLLKPEILLENIFPERLHTQFSELQIPLKVVATDYYGTKPVVIEEGDVLPAVAASISLPAIFRPVVINDVMMVDGGLTNPLPFDCIAKDVSRVIAIDVTGGPVSDGQQERPNMAEVLTAATEIMLNTIVGEKLKDHPPTIYLKAPVGKYPPLSFHKINEILEETIEFRDILKRAIEDKLG